MEQLPDVVKTVLQVGNGCQLPSSGDIVKFHRTLLTPEDEVIVSSLGLGEYKLPMDPNLMPDGLYAALSHMTVNEISWFSIHSNSTPNYGQQNSSDILGQLTRGGKCLLHLIDILSDPGKENQTKQIGKENPRSKPENKPKLSAEKQPKQTRKEKQAREEKEKMAEIEKQRKGKGKLGDVEKKNKPEKQPKKLLADAIKASEEKQPKQTWKEKQARKTKAQIGLEKEKPGKNKPGEKQPLASAKKPEDFEEKAEKKPAIFENLETQTLGPSGPRSRSIWAQLFDIRLRTSWIVRFISIMVWFKQVWARIKQAWAFFKRVVRNRIFIKGIQFMVFGAIILGQKIKAVDKKKYPVKYGVLLGSGIFSLVLGFGVCFLFPRVGANFLVFLSYIEIWIGGLGYLP